MKRMNRAPLVLLSFRSAALSTLATAIAGTSVVACGGGAPEPAVPITESTSTEQKVKAVAATTDLSPVAEPRGLVAYASFGKPMGSASFASNLIGMPLGDGLASELAKELLHDRAMADALDLKKPVNFVFTVDKDQGMKKGMALSIPLRELADAKAILGNRFAMMQDGVFTWLEPKKANNKADEEESSSEDACAVMASYEKGGSGSRVVCGDSRLSIREIGPYLVRGATRRTEVSDVYVEGKLDAIREQAAQGIETLRGLTGMLAGKKGAGFLPFLDTTITEVGAFATKDLAKATFELELGTGMVGSISAFMQGKSSAITRVLDSRMDRVGPAPASFFKLPIDAASAGYRSGFEEKELETMKVKLSEGIRLELSTRKPPPKPADLQQLEDFVSKVVHFYSMPSVAASGFESGLKIGQNQWGVSRTEEAFAGVAQTFALTEAIFNRNAAVKSILSELKKNGFAISVRKVAAKGFPQSAGMELSYTMPPATKAGKKVPGKTTKSVILAVAQDTGTLVVNGSTDAIAQKRLKATLEAPMEKTLAKREGIDALKNARAVSGGFMEPRALWQFEEIAELIPANLKTVLADPKMGVAPIFVFGTIDGAKHSFSFDVSKPVLEDVKKALLGMH